MVRRAAILAAVLLLAACGGGSSSKPPPSSSTGTASAPNSLKPSGGFFTSLFSSNTAVSCPYVSKIPDAAQLTRFAGTGHDLTDVLFEARMGDINGSCSAGSNLIQVKMTVDFIASRGPADKTHKAPFGYFVAITDSHDKILVRQQFDTSVDFVGNKTRDGIRENLEPTIPLQQGQRGDDFRIYVGFVLSREEYEYNRAHPL
jgi:hypothetical protein